MTRRWIWLQDYSPTGLNLYTDAGIDAALAEYGPKFSDFVVAARLDGDSRTWFRSTEMTMYPRVIDGVSPGECFIQRAHALGKRVHLWFIVGYWSTYNQLYVPLPAAWNTQVLGTAECRGTLNWINFSIADARQRIADILVDYGEQNTGLDGIHLDYARYHWTQSSCASFLTTQLENLYSRVHGGIAALETLELTAAIGGSTTTNENVHRPVVAMIEHGYVDYMLMMAYYTFTVAQKIDYIENTLALLPGWEAHRMAPGLGCEDGFASFQTQYDDWVAGGYNHFCLFDNTSETAAMIALLPDIAALTMADHPQYPAIEVQRADMFAHIAAMQTARGTPYLQLLKTPEDAQYGIEPTTFDTSRKPDDVADDWTECGGALAFSGTRGQYYCDVYNGPLGHGYICGVEVYWNGSTWRYQHHVGPEARSGTFDAWEEI